MARKAPPQPPPKPNPDSQELAFHFNTKFDCMPNVFQTSTPSRPSIGEKYEIIIYLPRDANICKKNLHILGAICLFMAQNTLEIRIRFVSILCKEMKL